MAHAPKVARPKHVLEDPSARSIAMVYAVSFLDAAKSAGVENPLEELGEVLDAVHAQPEFCDLLSSAILNLETKQGLIERTLKPRCSEFLGHFLTVLAKHDRLDLLSTIYDEATQEFERRSGQQRVLVRSAVTLSSEQLESIRSQLKVALSKDPIVIPQVEPALLGGLIIQVQDTIFDGSVATRLTNLKQRLRERYVHEIQSGRNRFSSPEGN
ncbi:MAG: ATP synthase F1 subunit delta [Planctomycetota bacterium]|jgi:F-type H+-transporting ATPase subunit delta|nr:MAG: ATP synthase F1 subunit delta [Planctomycetota bacterium]